MRCSIMVWIGMILIVVAAGAPACRAEGAHPVADPVSITSGSVARFDPDAATAAYIATLSPAARARSNAYFEGGYWLTLWDFLIGVGMAWLLLSTRLSSGMRDLAVRATRYVWLQTAIYAVEYVTLTMVVMLPWASYEGYFRERQYAMSNQTLGGWLTDELKGLLLSLIFGTAALVAVYAVLRKTPKTAWIWGSVAMIGLLVVQIAISPTYLEPVFNDFQPLPDSALKRQILSLARANEIPATQVYEFDASKQTTKISAHVSGILGTARISLNDNLMHRSSPAEIKAVLGHEMGHYVMNHVYKTLLVFGVLIVIGFAVVLWSAKRIGTRRAEHWGIHGLSDPANFPLLFALFSTYALLLTPLLNTITRTMENEADAFGLNAAREPDGFAQAALQLSEYRKMQPGRLEEWVLYDHPSGWNRIHRAMIWKAENPGT
jgi:STE24 endopeptidase